MAREELIQSIEIACTIAHTLTFAAAGPADLRSDPIFAPVAVARKLFSKAIKTISYNIHIDIGWEAIWISAIWRLW
jgi:hypothetical protein